MKEEFIKDFIQKTNGYFSENRKNDVKSILENIPDDLYPTLMQVKFKSPKTMLLASIFGGLWGIDRFMLGNGALGVLKFITGGGFFIWLIIDLFSVKVRTQNYNLIQLYNLIVPEGEKIKSGASAKDLGNALWANRRLIINAAKDIKDSAVELQETMMPPGL